MIFLRRTSHIASIVILSACPATAFAQPLASQPTPRPTVTSQNPQEASAQPKPGAKPDERISNPAATGTNQSQSMPPQFVIQETTSGQQNEPSYEGLLTLFNGLLVLIGAGQVYTMVLQKKTMDSQKATMDKQQEAMDAQNKIMNTQSEIMTEQKDTARTQTDIARQQNELATRQVGIMESQGTIMQAQTNILRSSLDSSQIIERAYLDLSHVGALQIDTTHASVSLSMKNNGRTPSDILGGQINLAINNLPPGQFAWVPMSAGPQLPAAFINPGDTLYFGPIQLPLGSRTITANTAVLVIGHVDYKDRFGGFHRSGYARQLITPTPANGNNLVFSVATTGLNYDRPLTKEEQQQYAN